MLKLVDTRFEPSNVVFEQLSRTSSRPVSVFAVVFTMGASARSANWPGSVAFLSKVSVWRITLNYEVRTNLRRRQFRHAEPRGALPETGWDA